MLLVDHNVKGVAALVDRVLAMYLGEWIAEGAAAEVMRDETVRRVYLGGASTSAARPRGQLRRQGAGAAGRRTSASSTARPLAPAGRLAARARRRIRLAGRTERRRQDDALQRHLRARAVLGHDPLVRAVLRRDCSAAAIARGGVVQCPETRELFGDMTRAREPRPRRQRARRSPSVAERLAVAVRAVPDPARAARRRWPAR